MDAATLDIATIDKIVLESKFPYFQYTIKGPRQTAWRDGYPIQEPKHIVLSFDRYLCLLEDMANEQEWTDEDKEFVAHSLFASFNNPNFTDMWVHERVKPGKPWPTYDETHHNQVAVVAQATGMVTESLVYETQGRPGGPRDSVVKKLNELLAEAPAAVAVDEDELAAV